MPTASGSCPRYHPLAELAPRDDVSLAIAAQMAKTQHPNVYLDLSHLDADRIRHRFPGIDRLCRTFDLDITRDSIPVCPGAHYMIGGVTVDLDGRTTLPGLWAAGEVTSSGLHGANRLASNSLLEGLVYGARAAEDIVAVLDADGPRPLEVPPGRRDDLAGTARPGSTSATSANRSARSCGDGWASPATPPAWPRPPTGSTAGAATSCRSSSTTPTGWTMQNMLIVARLMIAAASARRESRGVHYRRDFPQPDPAINHHIPLQAVAPAPARTQEANGTLRMVPG